MWSVLKSGRENLIYTGLDIMKCWELLILGQKEIEGTFQEICTANIKTNFPFLHTINNA